jgi:hypothetical protein
MSEPDEVEAPVWRIRTGGGLLAAQPLSDALRLAHEHEDEKERAQLERDRELRAQLAAERRAELLMQGHTPKTPQELFQQVSFAQDRQDAIERRRLEKAEAELGKREPRITRWESKANVEAAAAEREVTPATKADVRELRGYITQLKAKLHALGGRP